MSVKNFPMLRLLVVSLAIIAILGLLLSAEAMPSPLGIAAVGVRGGSSSSSSGGIVIRLRLLDGSVEKIRVDETDESLTLGDILGPLGGLPEGSSVRIGTKTTASSEAAVSSLGDLAIKHGSMITVLPASSNNKTKSSGAPRFVSHKKKSSGSPREWDPYPELAKDYDAAVRRAKTKRSSRSGMSYTDISKLHSTLHTVEPQKEGPITRFYMCRVSAERFYSNGATQKKGSPTTTHNCRCGLLLGTTSKERVDQRPRKARTSLSSQTADQEFCTVAKVQAIWEPPGQQQAKKTALPSGKAGGKTKAKSKTKQKSTDDNDNKLYDAGVASKMLNPRVLKIARYLGLSPVGWIFSYQDDRLAEENSFETDGPQALFGLDVAVAGTLKAGAMKRKHDAKQAGIGIGGDNDNYDEHNETGDKFVTLAMDATTGATEAFQLSDVAVQMVHEGLFDPILKGSGENPPRVPMKHPVVVDGRETEVLDSVLCLVNTAVLSHSGTYCGSGSGNAVKKSNGGLTLKTKKRLVRALESDSDHDFLEAVCDFNILLALDEMLLSRTASANTKPTTTSTVDDDMETLCGLVKKWARGQKKGTVIDPKFKQRLRAYLG